MQEREKHRLTLKEMEEKTYPFPDVGVQGMLEDLLEKNVIKLPECKCPEEWGVPTTQNTTYTIEL